MTHPIDIYGVFLPGFAVLALLALVITNLLRKGLAWAHIYKWIWHRPLFDLALYVSVLGVTVLLATR